MTEHVYIFTDGSEKEGRASLAFAVTAIAKGEGYFAAYEARRIQDNKKNVTDDTAEIIGMIQAVSWIAAEHVAAEVHVRSDSHVAVGCAEGTQISRSNECAHRRECS